jgi:hydroxyacylglutathione hydrolase
VRQSLLKLRGLPDDTQILRHEYTPANIRFAKTIELGNGALLAASRRSPARRRLPTIPSTIGAEKAANLFRRRPARGGEIGRTCRRSGMAGVRRDP